MNATGTFFSHGNDRIMNPFTAAVRPFKTLFTIRDCDEMMEFGHWILSRCENGSTAACATAELAVELFYDVMRRSDRDGACGFVITVEEGDEEIFVTLCDGRDAAPGTRALEIAAMLGVRCTVREGIVGVRLGFSDAEGGSQNRSLGASEVTPAAPVETPEHEVITIEEVSIEKEVRIVETEEKKLLRQSFVNKTTAADYVRDIGGDVLDEVRDLESVDAEWTEKLHTLEADPSVENVCGFADGVLGAYVRVINNLFEFAALAYALSSLGAFLKENAEAIIADPKKLKTLILLLEHLGEDLGSWKEHIFGLQDTADIHYLDSSFFSSCMQIEGIITDKEIATDDDNDFEFF